MLILIYFEKLKKKRKKKFCAFKNERWMVMVEQKTMWTLLIAK